MFMSRMKIFALSMALLMTGACIRYHARPIEPGTALKDFASRTLADSELNKFFNANGLSPEWPLKSWDLDALTLASLFYHPDLDVARAQWAVARAAMISAGARPNPILGFTPGYNSTTPVSEVTPWIKTFSLDFTIETAGKRGLRKAQSRHLAQAAALNMAAVAWQVRSRLRRAMLALYNAEQAESLLSRQQELQAENAKLLEAQLAVGAVSAYEVTQARIALQTGRFEFLATVQDRDQARVNLASALGLPLSAISGLPISFDCFDRWQTDIPDGEARRRALLSRADVLVSLAEYAAAQSALQLEIARQYPDINIGPGYELDQVDSKWSLAISLSLPVLNLNRGPIREAEARRSEAASRFLALQAGVIAEIDSAIAALHSAVQQATVADSLLRQVQKQENTAQAVFALGEISKAELSGIRLELNSVSLARLNALVRTQQALGTLEESMQSSPEMNGWLNHLPAMTSGTNEDKKHD
jgi:cobalt-zinc-cadmium efflux system outer membrane protein